MWIAENQDGPPAKRRKTKDVSELPEGAVEVAVDEPANEMALEGNHYDAPVYFDPEQELGGQYLKYLILHDDLYIAYRWLL
jgi:hypothetical protein